MKLFVTFLLLTCLAFPALSQSQAQMTRYRQLGDNMENTLSRSNTRLQEFDSRILDNGHARMFTNYRLRFEDLTRSLRTSELLLDQFIRSNDRAEHIRRERDNYEGLIQELQEVRTDYDGWLRSIQ